LEKHRIPFKLRLKIAKDWKSFRALDNLIWKLKPPRRYKGLPEKILFIRNDRIGDAMVTLPVLRNLKLNYPGIEIHVVVSERNRFIFEDLKFVSRVMVLEPAGGEERRKGIFRILVIGDILRTISTFVLPYFFSKDFKEKIRTLREEQYDAVVELTGEKFNILLSRALSNYTVGAKVFGLFWLYSFYIQGNWVSHADRDHMTRKIEECVCDAFGLKFSDKDTTLPVSEKRVEGSGEKTRDILVHLGTSELRKLPSKTEAEVIEKLSGMRLLITDSGETERFKFYRAKYRNCRNIEFKLYGNLREAVKDALRCRLLLCYDGGQALYLSQFVGTVVIFGPGSVHLWKPYEFADYSLLREWRGVRAIKSKGQYGHAAIYYPIWCSPCYDIGCKTRPCLGKIESEFIVEVINSRIKVNDPEVESRR